MTSPDVAELVAELAGLADDYAREAAACRDAGGAWSLMLAAEHQRAAEQLRTLRDGLELVDDPAPRAIAHARAWAADARAHYERIARP